ncbi:MAG: hypothetical protein WAU33_16930 [Candidatus Binataceae bacterium]
MSDRKWVPAGLCVRSGVAALVAELESLAVPLAASIAAVRRLNEIPLAPSDDEFVGVGLLKMTPGFRKNFASAIRGTEQFKLSIERLVEETQRTSDRTSWMRRS